ncbi:hypothetical protein [Paraburkholderia kururiensis]|uniref:hypothetical protein n=1 Tax=Paraburkholderia kururiensis TaxID=984307 RepID=UPI0005AA5EE6|nr:hypothetical protein [Paraburkholderia kururiensis]
MSVLAQIIVAPVTAGVTSNPFQQGVADGPCTLVAGGLGASETATVQIQDASGNWQNAPAAIAAQMTQTVPAIAITVPGIYRVVKTATAAAVGVVLYRT